MQKDIKAYCSKCRVLVVIKDCKAAILRNGLKVWRGVCPNDGLEVIKGRK